MGKSNEKTKKLPPKTDVETTVFIKKKGTRKRVGTIKIGKSKESTDTYYQQHGIVPHEKDKSIFDAIIDGNHVSKSKPDPEVFLKGAEALQVSPETCIVFEDAEAGVEAAKRAGMMAIGIGDAHVLHQADKIIPNFTGVLASDLLKF